MIASPAGNGSAQRKLALVNANSAPNLPTQRKRLNRDSTAPSFSRAASALATGTNPIQSDRIESRPSRAPPFEGARPNLAIYALESPVAPKCRALVALASRRPSRAHAAAANMRAQTTRIVHADRDRRTTANGDRNDAENRYKIVTLRSRSRSSPASSSQLALGCLSLR